MTAWSVKGVDQATRDIARRAANAAGMTIGEWIDHAIQSDAVSRGVSLPTHPGSSMPGAPNLPVGGISADTAEAVFSRLDDGERLKEARLRPLGFALKDVAERLVSLERQARSAPQPALPAADPPRLADAGATGRGAHDQAGPSTPRPLPDGPPDSWSPDTELDRAQLTADAAASRDRPEPVAPTHDFDADPIDVSALGLADVAGPPGPGLATDAASRRTRRVALALAATVIVAVSGAVGWAIMRQGPLDWRALNSQELTGRLSAVPEVLRSDGQRLWDQSRQLWAEIALDRGLPLLGLGPDGSRDGSDTASGDSVATVSGPSSTDRGQARTDSAARPTLDDTIQSRDSEAQPAAAVPQTAQDVPPQAEDALVMSDRQTAAVQAENSQNSKGSSKVAPPVAVVPELVDPRPVAPPPAPALTDGQTQLRPTGSDATAARSPTTGIQARADAGDPAAQFNVAVDLLGPDPANPVNAAEAATWFREAAINGLAVAQFNLGVLYERGLGAARDDTRALLWYHSAAEQNFAPAQYNLARLYAEGRGIPRSDVEARRWYERAADGGVAAALYGLAVLEADVGDREKRMRTAAEAGDPSAQTWLRGRSAGADPSAGIGPAAPLVLSPPAGVSLVSDIQQALQERGYYQGAVDGIAGPVTRSAIARFQAENGLPATGLPSASLQRLLN